MLEETCRIARRLSVPCGWVSWMTWWPTSQRPFSQSKVVLGLMAFSSSAAATTKALKVEPGLEGVSDGAVAQRVRRRSRPGALGLKRGTLASARISPVFGSSTTAMPADGLARPRPRWSSAFSATYCSWRSRVSVTEAPWRLGGLRRRPGEELAAACVAEALQLAASAGELVFERELEPVEAVAVGADQADHVRRELALRVEAARLLVKPSPGSVERLHRGDLAAASPGASPRRSGVPSRGGSVELGGIEVERPGELAGGAGRGRAASTGRPRCESTSTLWASGTPRRSKMSPRRAGISISRTYWSSAMAREARPLEDLQADRAEQHRSERQHSIPPISSTRARIHRVSSAGGRPRSDERRRLIARAAVRQRAPTLGRVHGDGSGPRGDRVDHRGIRPGPSPAARGPAPRDARDASASPARA